MSDEHLGRLPDVHGLRIFDADGWHGFHPTRDELLRETNSGETFVVRLDPSDPHYVVIQRRYGHDVHPAGIASDPRFDELKD